VIGDTLEVLSQSFEKLSERIRTEFDDFLGPIPVKKGPEPRGRPRTADYGMIIDALVNEKQALEDKLAKSEAERDRYKVAYENLRDMIREIDTSRI